MSATQPRVRVEQIGETGWTVRLGSAGLWKWTCPIENHPGDASEGTGWGYATAEAAQEDATEHETYCPAFRLAALLASLETLEAQWRTEADKSEAAALKQAFGSTGNIAGTVIAGAVRGSADDLHRVIEGARG